MELQDPPGKKDSKQKKQTAQSYKEPPPEVVREVTELRLEEEAGVPSFREPTIEDTFSEEAAASEMQAAFGIDENILQIKREIEAQLLHTAGQQKAGVVQAAEAFQGTGNIVGVGVGVSLPPTAGPGGEILSSGMEPGRQALNLYVIERTSAEAARAVVAEAMGVSAAASEEVPVNIIVTGIIDAQPHRFRMRPAPGGISVAHFRVTAGTLGCLSIGRTAPRNSRLMMLSNNHVLANTNDAVFGDCICQPGPLDGGSCPADQVAILERFVPIDFAAGAVNFVDCATGWCWPDRVRKELVQLVGGQPQFFRIGSVPVAPQVNMAVGKSGRTTQLTRGTIIDVSASVNVNYGGGRVGFFRDQISIRGAAGTLFSSGGDSGSSIWTWDNARRPVGLLFAGGGGITFANKMSRVVAALDINLVT
ncbi:MAG TPA: hypothetical protein VMS31_10580 [Pyrinomonadaceae bacterium]|nr:hypothetical protein [Pyrinomonadaceae bacterium]